MKKIIVYVWQDLLHIEIIMIDEKNYCMCMIKIIVCWDLVCVCWNYYDRW